LIHRIIQELRIGNIIIVMLILMIHGVARWHVPKWELKHHLKPKIDA
jgi:hypothetical protein